MTDTTDTALIVTDATGTGTEAKRGAVVQRTKHQSGLFTAAQITDNCPNELANLGRRISVHLEKAARCTEQAKNHQLSAGQLLAQAKDACDKGGFDAFRARFCPKLGKTRAYELLAIASGKKTIEQSRAETAERVRKSRAIQKAADDSVTVTEKPPAVGTAAEATAEPAKPSPPTEAKAEPTVEEAEAEVARLKALKAKIGANDDTKIEVSADALSKFLAACEAWLPNMNSDDLQAAIDHFADVVEVPAKELLPDLSRMQFELKIAKAEITALKRKLAGKLPANESRAAAWARLASEAVANIEELIGYQSEFEEKKENLPDNLQDGPFAQKCEVVCDIDLQAALEIVQDAENADLPLGFGRD